MRILSLALSTPRYQELLAYVRFQLSSCVQLAMASRKRSYTSSEVVRLLNNTDSDLESDSELDSCSLDSSFQYLSSRCNFGLQYGPRAAAAPPTAALPAQQQPQN